MWLLWVGLGWAGYGDAVEGFPSHAERELHLWTNAVRVEPSYFAEDYLRAGCRFEDFEPEEQLPQDPLAWSSSLNRAARVHAVDMQTNRFVDHTGSDGVRFEDRVAQYYPSTAVGENVAGGYASSYQVVASGWMCSPGHRSNIMSDWWTELGAGVSGGYYTQNFGGRGAQPRVLNMGVHIPEAPSGGDVTYLVDVSAVDKPDDVVLVLNGVAHTMKTEIGRVRRGIRMVKVPLASGCQVYWFESTVAGETHRFPETGAYGYGDCAFDDMDAQWMAADTLAGPLSPVAASDDIESKGGCASTGGLGMLWWGVSILALRRRRQITSPAA